MSPDEEVERALRVLRALGQGREPYALNVLPMVKALRAAEQRPAIVAQLEKLRDELHGTAWVGSQAFRPYEAVCDVLDELHYAE